MGKRTCKNTENLSKNEWVNSKHLLGSESTKPHLLTFLEWKYFLACCSFFSLHFWNFPTFTGQRSISKMTGKSKSASTGKRETIYKASLLPLHAISLDQVQLGDGMGKLPSNKAFRFWLCPAMTKLWCNWDSFTDRSYNVFHYLIMSRRIINPDLLCWFWWKEPAP